MTDEQRPDSRTARRGELRIYLGAAPGVGKTYAMLGEARRRLDRGTDVVVGLVETHGRARTADLLTGLEVLPRRTFRHRGVELTELDVDAVLDRRPQVVLIDELAHSNAPGSRNRKRCQDIEELLDAGIDVITTVNIQHLASLNDVVARITGSVQQETVPDEVLRRAEQLELVDITPEALRRRLAHGNVYAAHQIDAALGNYFRPGNLTALRELALLWVADQVDVALQRHRADEHVTETWEARERVVVAVTGGPESEMLIRRGRRIASRAGAELLVLHALRGDGLAGTPATAVAGLRGLAEDVGASLHTVVGDDVPDALLEFARGVNATQLVLGTSRRSRLARLFDEGIGATVVRSSGSIDVHMVTHPEARRRWRPQRHGSPLGRGRVLLGWVLAVAGPTLVTAAGFLLGERLTFANQVLLQVLVVVLVAVLGGLGPSLGAVVAAGLELNFFFARPYYTLLLEAPRDAVTLGVMLVVAVAVALVVDRAARRGKQATEAHTEATLLASYARTMLTHEQPVDRLVDKIRENFGLSNVTLLEWRDGRWRRIAASGPTPCDRPADAGIDVAIADDVHFALDGRTLTAVERGTLEAVAGQALLALRQQRMAAEAGQARRHAEANELRTALLSAVGHDLRTPLTSIKAALGSLRAPDIELAADDRAELLGLVENATDRLNALVGNLLDSSRIATGTVAPALQPIGYDEAVARALTTLDLPAGVRVDVDDRLPRVLADPGLLERVIANVVDNAVRHGTPQDDGEPAVAIRASVHHHQVELRVVDHGPGLPKGSTEQAFTPFQRLAARNAGSGIGLGLSVAKGFIDAMGGRIAAEDTPAGGLTVVITLPTTTSPVPQEV